jgi:hypothetical protein
MPDPDLFKMFNWAPNYPRYEHVYSSWQLIQDMSKPLPFEPQPDAELQARFELALEPHQDIHFPPDPATGLQRKHVFDFEDGVRAIVSIDYDGGTEPAEKYLHVSIGACSEAAWERVPERIEPVLGVLFNGRKPELVERAMTEVAIHLFFRWSTF